MRMHALIALFVFLSSAIAYGAAIHVPAHLSDFERLGGLVINRIANYAPSFADVSNLSRASRFVNSQVQDELKNRKRERSELIKRWKTEDIQSDLLTCVTSAESIVFSPDSKFLAIGSYDGLLELWNLQKRKKVMSKEHGGYSLAFSPDGRTLASGLSDGTIRLWDVNTGESIAILKGPHSQVFSVAFSPDGKLLAATYADENGSLILWSLPKFKKFKVFKHARACSISFSPSGRMLAVACEEAFCQGIDTIKIWDLKTKKSKIVAQGIWWLEQVVFLPSGNSVAAGFRNAIGIWDVTRCVKISELLLSKDYHNMIRVDVLSFYNRLLASGSRDGIVRLWDSITGQQIKELPKYDKVSITALAFSPDGTLLVSGSRDGDVRLWYPVHKYDEASENTFAFLPDGTLLASGSREGDAGLWYTVYKEKL